MGWPHSSKSKGTPSHRTHIMTCSHPPSQLVMKPTQQNTVSTQCRYIESICRYLTLFLSHCSCRYVPLATPYTSTAPVFHSYTLLPKLGTLLVGVLYYHFGSLFRGHRIFEAPRCLPSGSQSLWRWRRVGAGQGAAPSSGPGRISYKFLWVCI